MNERSATAIGSLMDLSHTSAWCILAAAREAEKKSAGFLEAEQAYRSYSRLSGEFTLGGCLTHLSIRI
jgi:hypothetical protein